MRYCKRGHAEIADSNALFNFCTECEFNFEGEFFNKEENFICPHPLNHTFYDAKGGDTTITLKCTGKKIVLTDEEYKALKESFNE